MRVVNTRPFPIRSARQVDPPRSGLASPCPICSNSRQITPIAEIPQLPTNSLLLYSTKQEAIHVPMREIRLVFCETCGHTFNSAFDPDSMEYCPSYENSLHFSPRFQHYAESLAKRLIERYRIANKNAIELGCGKGDFLNLLCDLGNNKGVGFDPSYEFSESEFSDSRVKFIQDFYSEQYSDYQADLIVARHVLEHIYDPIRFLRILRQTIHDRRDTVLYFEVPSMDTTMRELDIWNIIYEHCAYFSRSSIVHLFKACGFEVSHVGESFGQQFLYIEALPADQPSLDTSDLLPLESSLTQAAMNFAEQYFSRIRAWRTQLAHFKSAQQKVVVWGSGARGVTFLNALETQNQIKYVVDINPRKQGKYVAGSGQQIVAPEFLTHYQPDVLILMNSIYLEEVQQQTQHLGLSPQFLCATDPL